MKRFGCVLSKRLYECGVVLLLLVILPVMLFSWEGSVYAANGLDGSGGQGESSGEQGSGSGSQGVGSIFDMLDELESIEEIEKEFQGILKKLDAALNINTDARYGLIIPYNVYEQSLRPNVFMGLSGGIFSDGGPIAVILPTEEESDQVEAELAELVGSIAILSKAAKITDAEALKTDLSECHIIAFGTMEGNLWLKAHASGFPFAADKDRLSAEIVYSGENLGIITCLPNPLNKSRGLLIYTAQRAEDIKDIMAVTHGVTDFVIAKGNEVLFEGNYSKSGGEWNFVRPPKLTMIQMEYDLLTVAYIFETYYPGLHLNKKLYGIDMLAEILEARRRLGSITDTYQFASLIDEILNLCQDEGVRILPFDGGAFVSAQYAHMAASQLMNVDEYKQLSRQYQLHLNQRVPEVALRLPILYLVGEYYVVRGFEYDGVKFERGLKLVECNGSDIHKFVGGLAREIKLDWDTVRGRFYSENFYRVSPSVAASGAIDLAFADRNGGRIAGRFDISRLCAIEGMAIGDDNASGEYVDESYFDELYDEWYEDEFYDDEDFDDAEGDEMGLEELFGKYLDEEDFPEEGVPMDEIGFALADKLIDMILSGELEVEIPEGVSEEEFLSNLAMAKKMLKGFAEGDFEGFDFDEMFGEGYEDYDEYYDEDYYDDPEFYDEDYEDEYYEDDEDYKPAPNVQYLEKEKILYLKLPCYESEILAAAEGKEIRKVVIDTRGRADVSTGEEAEGMNIFMASPVKIDPRSFLGAIIDQPITVPVKLLYKKIIPNLTSTALKSIEDVKLALLDSQIFEIYNTEETYENYYRSLNYSGKIFVLQDETTRPEMDYVVRLANECERVISIGTPVKGNRGRLNNQKMSFILPYSKLHVSVESAVDYTGVEKLKDFFHNGVELQLELGVDYYLDRVGYKGDLHSYDYLVNHDPLFKAVLECDM